MYYSTEKTYTVQEIAERLCVSDEAVYRWRRNGDIKTMSSSRKNGYVVSQVELEKFLKKNNKYKTIWLSRGGEIIYGECI